MKGSFHNCEVRRVIQDEGLPGHDSQCIVNSPSRS